jgi:hypothetical protein
MSAFDGGLGLADGAGGEGKQCDGQHGITPMELVFVYYLLSELREE